MEGAQEAELVTRLVLNGTVFMVRLAGQTAAGAAKLLTFLAAAAKSESVSGQKRLADLLRTGKPVQVFTLDEAQLGKFKEEAKRYGIAYSLVKRGEQDKDAGTYDVMVKEEDAVRLNRVLDRIGYATVPTLTAEEMDEQAEGTSVSEIRELINRMMQPDERAVNPQEAADMKDSPSAASSMAADLPEDERGSVARKINEINTELENTPAEEKDTMASLLQMMLNQEELPSYVNKHKPQEKVKNLSGQTKLGTFLKSGKEAYVLTFNEAQLADFKKEAKRYGIAYSVVKRSGEDIAEGTLDVLVYEEDAGLINPILEEIGHEPMYIGNTYESQELHVSAIKEKDTMEDGLEEINAAFEKLMGSLNRANTDKERS